MTSTATVEQARIRITATRIRELDNIVARAATANEKALALLNEMLFDRSEDESPTVEALARIYGRVARGEAKSALDECATLVNAFNAFL